MPLITVAATDVGLSIAQVKVSVVCSCIHWDDLCNIFVNSNG